MKDRILQFLKAENKTSSHFADEIGVQPSSISHIISGRNKPSLDFVIRMLSTYSDLSSDWLLFGKGEMYKDGTIPPVEGLFDMSTLHERADLRQSEIIENGNDRQASPSLVESGSKDNIPFRDYAEDENVNIRNKPAKRIIIIHTDGSYSEYFPD